MAKKDMGIVVREDMRALGLTREVALDRKFWRRAMRRQVASPFSKLTGFTKCQMKKKKNNKKKTTTNKKMAPVRSYLQM